MQTDIVPSETNNPIFGMRLVPHMMTNFAVISGITVASTANNNKILDSINVVGDFLHSLSR